MTTTPLAVAFYRNTFGQLIPLSAVEAVEASGMDAYLIRFMDGRGQCMTGDRIVWGSE